MKPRGEEVNLLILHRLVSVGQLTDLESQTLRIYCDLDDGRLQRDQHINIISTPLKYLPFIL